MVLAASNEDATRIITTAELTANASDADHDSLGVTGLSISNGNGTLADNHDGTWTYTPAANDDTGVTFSYTVDDGHNGSVAASATLDLTPVNDAPTVSVSRLSNWKRPFVAAIHPIRSVIAADTGSRHFCSRARHTSLRIASATRAPRTSGSMRQSVSR